jgi:hypothetical protein
LVYLSLLILLLSGLLWPVRWLVRRKFGATLALERRELISYRLTRTFSLLILVALVCWMVVLSMLGELSRLNSGFDPILYIVQILTFVALVGGLLVVGRDAWLVWRGKRRWTSKLWSIALLFAVLVMLWVGWSFHLLDFGANY